MVQAIRSARGRLSHIAQRLLGKGDATLPLTAALAAFMPPAPALAPPPASPPAAPFPPFPSSVPQSVNAQRDVTDEPPTASTDTPTHRYRAIWISDIHLGTAGCQATYLLDFLKHNESDQLYLVGDIIDGWQLKRGWYWPQSHNDVVQKLLRKARKGTEVIFVPGNHDEVARQFDGMAFGDIVVREDAIHVTATGRRLWVVHGDLFDGVVQHARWLAYLGDSLYTLILAVNRHFNRVRTRLGFDYWSLSQYLKHQVKNAVSYINSFEHAMVEEARRRGCDGVVCGHIHKAEIREVDGQLYCNDGDWVESLSALVETMEGELRIVYWTTLLDPPAPPTSRIGRRRRTATTATAVAG
ncbi:UDP-2,3-diacylglucosamine diphosphatase [Cupriavidus plantarum]|uniref:UDP-2,3-diacylglucosamine pyrophosphatase LpxH n=1 Tax=Cupriavidus plantarum TaxID=942865 RepID=A0A316F385_9BURK|nr:UDP-2,3-diacylglucosamine diphosphatase [Cupriavidus plantarum]NYH98327.1 UDP-2,3-diacylglucosamine pyrophosphatase LpxH [Cupriavidus plantarum]PWK38043.1 UDP-2,3-diacylglucosamine pyrophosphatase LpxH [Cupriavidus plantarum]RLK45883.1 UDP-2,3-diacylglucosamine pyrophosphatase LpxH [Cupriavidus plantarum]CAG2127764.1 UDP-2,3-diacylglucosamine hydrolase [Cupriavidus plantarum]SMR67058.1 UDP-2,3-diacylglucosamine pyrophosphatase LpxH [Cupriavidus plantarum]